MSQNNGSSTSLRLKTGLAEMLKGGVIMDVTNAEQAVIAEKAGAVSVMALERVPAQIRAEGGVARMASPKKIREIMAAVSIPVMAKCRIGHFAEAQILQELGVDYIDESEVLTPADEAHHVDKHAFKVPFVCGARNLGEALRRIAEGAAMIRTKGEAGTGDVVHAVKHMRQIVQEMRILTVLGEEELYAKAKEHQAPYELVRMVAKAGKLPVPNFSAGGIATPADASLVMQLGAESVFVGSGIFMQDSTTFADPEEAEKRAKAIVLAATHFNDPKVLLEVSEDLTGRDEGPGGGGHWMRPTCCRRGAGSAAVAAARCERWQTLARASRLDAGATNSMKIGVLALQGDFDAHRRRLEELGAEVVLVKKPEQLDEIDGLVIPGGESGTFLKLLGEAGFEKLKQFARTKPTFGTCAGAILLASEVDNPKQAGLGVLDIGIRRNAYGRQVDSSIREGRSEAGVTD